MAVTAGKISGNILLQSLDGDTILCTTNATLNLTNEEQEDTCKDDNGAYTASPGQQRWSAQIEGMVVFDNAYGIKDINVLAKNATTVSMIFGTSGNQGAGGDPYWMGDCFISNYDLNAPLNQTATWSITLTPKGPLYLFNS